LDFVKILAKTCANF